ncbi:hypothetical protein I7I48_12214 [Histoplasma ohiense]|nr:hypothetical protein I7I48_12214 [Histoplasma ohiense (nom. inval.)]
MQLVSEGLQEAVCRVAALTSENDKLLIRNTLLKEILAMCNLYQTELEVQKECQCVEAAQQQAVDAVSFADSLTNVRNEQDTQVADLR